MPHSKWIRCAASLWRVTLRRCLGYRLILVLGLFFVTLAAISFRGNSLSDTAGMKFVTRLYKASWAEPEMTWNQLNENTKHIGQLVRQIKISNGFGINQHKNFSTTYYDFVPLNLENNKRHARIQNICHGKEEKFIGLSTEQWAYDRIEINQKYNILYCPLLKGGSTFWRRVFYAIRHGRVINTPYDISVQQGLMGKRDTLGKSFPLKTPSKQTFLKNAFKLMFVREPYSRLLSGYIDKLFAPNPYFWNSVGKYIIANFRENPSVRSRKCGHDVTFPEFIKYVIYAEENNDTHRDAHFTPAYDQCKPCQIDYNVIGKMDTFKEDTAFIFSNMGYNLSKSILREWAKTAEEDAVSDSTRSPFSWWTWILRCMSPEEAGKRIWRKMQIRGFVDKRIKLPYKRRDLKSMPPARFIKALLKSRASSDRTEMKKQKLEALMEAFSLVPIEDIEKIQTLFRPDFDLFNYDLDLIFRKSSSVPYTPWVFDLNSV